MKPARLADLVEALPSYGGDELGAKLFKRTAAGKMVRTPKARVILIHERHRAVLAEALRNLR